MLSLALFYILAVICLARQTHARPLYPDTSLEPQEGRQENLDGENTELTDQREVKNLYPLLLLRDGARDTWNKVDDLKVVVLKLAAADKLRSQGFLRSEQNLPKTNKRACFWKYCVTN
uniref:Urotensin-related peptide 1 n=1 Tax=Hucho hucho TaxID=62062 RepID=A0A4W5N2C6_9TELE